MGYTPYKMLGHELKGPNQRETPATLKAFGTKDSDGVDKISTTPGMPFSAQGGVGSSPNKFFKKLLSRLDPRKMIEKLKKARAKKAAEKEAAAAGVEGEVATHGDEAHSDGGAVGGVGDAAEAGGTGLEGKISTAATQDLGTMGGAATVPAAKDPALTEEVIPGTEEVMPGEEEELI